MAVPPTRISLAESSLPAADDAWREKQRKLAEARARLLAAKVAPHPAEPSREAAAPPASAPMAIAREALEHDAPLAGAEEDLVCGPFLPRREWFSYRYAPGGKVRPLGESLPLPSLAEDATLHVALNRALHERDNEARRFIKRLVSRLGDAAARALYAETQAIEASGGMSTESGGRCRSSGGVFLQLARKHLGPDVFVEAQVLAMLAAGRLPRRWR